MTLSEAILQAASPRKLLPCAIAFKVSQATATSPADVGEVATELGVRIVRCQLGLFGYGTPHTPSDKRLEPQDSYPAELLQRLESWRGKRLPCVDAWAIAEAVKVPRLTLGSAAESLGIRITACQLGCFQRC